MPERNARPAEEPAEEPLDESRAPAPSARASFPCPECGASTTWDPDADALSCAHCGTARAVPRAAGEIVERPLEDVGTAARGLGLATRSLRCEECGAEQLLDAATTSITCAFCGAPAVLAQEASRNLIRPESILPLDVGRTAVEAAFRAWLARRWFAPRALKRLRAFDALGLYVPTWTFDAQVHSRWTADAGYHYVETRPVTVIENGRPTVRMQQVQRTRWEPAVGDRRDAYDDVLVHASRGVSQDMAERLGPYDMTALVPYRPEYLAGWRAEEYQIDLEQGWSVASRLIAQRQQARCSADVPGDTQRNLRVDNDVTNVRWKHLLLPLWSLSYAYGGRRYTVLVHGQTGRVHGEAPRSAWKILALVLLVAIVAALLALAAAKS